jgi:hypothetical protein
MPASLTLYYCHWNSHTTIMGDSIWQATWQRSILYFAVRTASDYGGVQSRRTTTARTSPCGFCGPFLHSTPQASHYIGAT